MALSSTSTARLETIRRVLRRLFSSIARYLFSSSRTYFIVASSFSFSLSSIVSFSLWVSCSPMPSLKGCVHPTWTSLHSASPGSNIKEAAGGVSSGWRFSTACSWGFDLMLLTGVSLVVRWKSREVVSHGGENTVASSSRRALRSLSLSSVWLALENCSSSSPNVDSILSKTLFSLPSMPRRLAKIDKASASSMLGLVGMPFGSLTCSTAVPFINDETHFVSTRVFSCP